MTDTCRVCGSDDRPLHDENVANGTIHHRWSNNGELVRAEPPTPKKPPRVAASTVIGAWDLELRQVLINKGIISNEDFTSLRHAEPSPTGDRETGEAESSG